MRRPLRSYSRTTPLVFGWLLALSASAAPPPPNILLLDAARAGPAIVAVGERGAIFRSADSGRSWASIPSPATATLTGVAFAPDGRHGWAVGHDAFIAATADGGLTWHRQWQGANLESSFLDVCALDARHAIAIGAYNLCRATADAGKTWTPRKVLDDDRHLNRITLGPTGTLYIAGERGTLLRSTDHGESWRAIDSPYDGSFYGILPLGPHTLLAHGLRGRVFRSDNDGNLWQPVPLDQPMLISTALKTKAGALLLAGQSRAFYVSRDDGRSFQPFAPGFTSAVAELIEAPDGTVLAFGEAGVTEVIVPAATLSPVAPVR